MMITRFLTLSLFALPCVLSASHVHAEQRRPTCFPDMKAFMVDRYGTNFRDDENLHVTEPIFGKIKFSMFEDMTSGTNHSHVLLRSNNRNEICIVLRTAPAAQLDLVKVNHAGVPEEFRTIDQAPPGFPQNEIFYRLTSGGHYTAVVCNELLWKGKLLVRKGVACPAPETI